MAKTFNQTAAIRGALRRVFSRSPIVREVLMEVRREVPKFNQDGSRSKKDAVQYKCAVCNEYVKSTAVSVDHIVPVISINTGFEDWNVFVSRLFCSKENLQPICDTCHNTKTQSERLTRLTRQYNAELDVIERDIFISKDMKEVKKTLKKYISKKKVEGLASVAVRAESLLALVINRGLV